MPTSAPRQGELLLPYPHPGQIAIRKQARRFNWLAAGRRWRKTSLVMAIAAEAALSGQQILWGAPVYDQVRIGWEELRHAASRVAKLNATLLTARFPSGGSITFRSLDNPDNARGHTADGVVLDETGDIQDVAWNEVLRPTLLDSHGWLWAVGSPRGLNWFWREWLAARERDDSMSWQAPTLGARIGEHGLERVPHLLENPSIHFGELATMYESMGERSFRQEILGEFLEAGGGIFRNLDMACTLQPKPPEDGHMHVIGVDWALSHDFTVLSVLDITAHEQRRIERFNLLDYHFQTERLQTVFDTYKPVAIIAEINSIGAPLIQDLQRRGLPVYPFLTTAVSKKIAIEALALAIERGQIKLLVDPIQKGELLAFESQPLPSGMIRYTAPEGGHDDTVMALAMAWHAVTHGGGVQEVTELVFG